MGGDREDPETHAKASQQHPSRRGRREGGGVHVEGP